MKPLDINEVQAFTEQRIADWDQRRIGMLNMLSLDTLLSPHPYSFVTERSRSAGDVISMALDAAQAAHGHSAVGSPGRTTIGCTGY
ncbi:hypothetical protein [Candidatus Amarolinea dominans]|uniref:hypothetical protein n=1 Tax=Candidatus Amarolinea dominans TaxID=3140696 RepID=UPI003135FF08|nr:hypothetical protein [Anaerolineae bacterium]